MIMKHICVYVDKDGNERRYEYEYDTSKWHRNNEIVKLQKRKTYYKKKGDLEKVKTIDILIGIEKRKEMMKRGEQN